MRPSTILCLGKRNDGVDRSIEDTFKNIKQFLETAQPQSWKNQRPELAALA
ncbi:MAG: hypothetical protein WC975_13250 [Phycisphaerae bacterium]